MDKDDIALELSNLSERLRLLEMSVTRMTEQLRAHVEQYRALLLRLEAVVDKHERVIFGNDGLGLKTRLDRIEEKEKAKRWNLRVLWVALLGLLSTIFYELFFSKR